VTRYQDVYPSDALLRSYDVVRPRAAELLNLEYFEAEPDGMPTAVFEQHHLLVNLKDEPHRVENWRGGVHRAFEYRRDEIVLTPAGVQSGWRWHARSKVIVITIDPERLARFARSELGLVLTARQLKDVPQAHDPDLTQAATMLLEALQRGGSGSEVVFESLARIFLVKLLQRYGEARADALEFSRSFTARHFRRVLDHIERNYGGSITIEDLAKVAALSAAHFSRVFKEVTGDTPYQFVMDYRVEQAKRMLADRERPLIDVALACGFADQPHFTRVFKQLTGKTPREWRTGD
jgi:AraC family transcriptional regulator